MIRIPGYQVVEEIYESAGSLVYRGRREQDSQPVILKVLKSEYPTPEAIARYLLEYQITRNLNLEGAVKAYGLSKYNNSYVIILEDFGGESLKIWMKSRKFAQSEILTVAIRTADILGKIHQQNIIHKDINPSNIVYNPATGIVKIIDFGISTVLSRENPTLNNPNVLEGTLAYMSPEQTGRMNRAIDYRTDFYSFGATLYELLTHQLPFEGALDAIALVHCHIAKPPQPPHKINPEIAKAVSDLVMKLLEKTAESRYQSAWGIKADLSECLSQLMTKGIISEFPLCRQDISDKFQIPQKLYGRETEVETLLAAFERVGAGSPRPSKSEIMLVSGYSGIGKSALVQEIYKPITRQRGYFISGKFDQFQRNIPYSAAIAAFSELIRQLLTESEAQIALWREKLQAALGVNGQVIIDVIPEVELILGKQPSVPELGPTESQNRFNFVFQNFIKVFTKPEHPLVIFLDDLQWADSASLKLIQLLMTAADSKYLLVIGAYRDNEVGAAHPLMLTLDEIKKAGAIANHISLAPLGLNQVNQLIADTLNCEVEKASPLAELVLQKTGGNPFFMNEFLKSLYADEHLLNFDFNRGGWQWNQEEIKAARITDNVVELMDIKIQKLSEQGQQVLSLAACIGNQFDLKTLAIAREKSQSETADELWAAVDAGLILPVGNDYKFLQADVTAHKLNVAYKFLHDRVQQAAYSLMRETTKQALHRQIGQLLLKNTPPDKLEEKIFDIVNQLNFGIQLITSGLERDELAQLNQIAGKKAKISTAYQPAFNYLQVGIGLLATDSWEQQYHLTLSLYEQAAEVAYLNADTVQMEKLVEAVMSKAKTVLEKVKVYEVKILAYIAQSKFREAIALGLEVLKLLGVRLPKQPRKLDVLLGLLRTKLRIGRKAIASLVDKPPMTDPYHKAAMRILTRIASPAYFAAPLLMPLIVFKLVSLSLKWGNASESAYAYAVYGMILCGVVGDIESGYQFGQLALNLLERLNARELKASTEYMFHAFIRYWVKPAKESLNLLLETYAVGLETGQLEYAAYSTAVYCYYAFLLGSELAQLQSKMATDAQVIRQMGQERTVDLHEIFHQAVLNLIDQSKNPCCLIGKAFDEQARLPMLQSKNDRTGICYLYFNKLMLCYLFGEEGQAVANAEVAEQDLDSATAQLMISHFYFYDSLARLAVATDASQSERSRLTRKVQANQKKMQKWARHAPANNLHKFYLVEAERYRVLGQDVCAMEMYKKAIDTAKENDYIHQEALANELAAKFYLAKGQDKIASVYMQDARYCYQLWGATAKVKELDKRYPALLSLKSSVTRTGAIGTTSTGSSTSDSGSWSSLDLATVMKASQALSGEIVLNKLLAKLMKILIENAGAQKGFLILESKSQLRIEASGAVEPDDVTVLQSIPIEGSDTATALLPAAIINYVARTKESVVLNDATREGKFTLDPYILENKPKSILCAPLLKGGNLSGIVYLENNLTTGAFTPDRLEVLKLLSGQAAISIENAKLYTELRSSESRLTQFLEAVPVGVFVADASGTPYYANQTAQQILGKGIVPSVNMEQLAEIYQIYLAGCDRLYPSDRAALLLALKGEKATLDDMEVHQPDKIIPIEVWSTPIFDEKGNIAYAIVAFQDITERKRAEAERIEFTNELFQLNQAFSRFVPRQFLHFLNKSSIVDVKLGDQVQMEMSVLFSDIRDFTTLSESMTPEDNFKFINSYLSCMEPAIIENQGFIDKYIGDAIMALFGGSADDAVKAAIAMLHRLTEYNQHRAKSGYITIQIGIGINTGSLMLGTVGGNNRMDGTVISDAVNLASRVESLTKNYGVSILITQQTLLRLRNPGEYGIRPLDTVKVKGKSEIVSVYEVFDGDKPDIREGKKATAQVFVEALSYYNLQNFSAAAQLFEDCRRQNPMDNVAKIYLERCQQHFRHNS